MDTKQPTYRKKLIEVALPLEAINQASVREKSIRHGHPSTLHLWWARRPLAACRAVIFASLVDDPDEPEAPPQFVEACRRLPRGKNATANDTPRQRLFDLIERLVTWEATTDEEILDQARELIRMCTDGNPPPLLDPFAGGGSIPLEAQRLGLEAHASDLNPVAVLICKALIEIPPRFAGRPPVNPRDGAGTGGGGSWRGAGGLAADIRYYGEWMRERAWERIGHLYPKVEVTAETARERPDLKPYVGRKLTVIAWLWARTVRCPNPACSGQLPLLSSFWISKVPGKKVWLQPLIDRRAREVRFALRTDEDEPPRGTVSRTGANCLICGQSVPLDFVRNEGRHARISAQLTAVVAEGHRKRLFLQADRTAIPDAPFSDFLHDVEAPVISGYFNPPLYGYVTIGSMFAARQRAALQVFSELVSEARELCLSHCEDEDYATAVAVYLTLGVGRLSNRLSAFSIWNTQRFTIEQTFSEQGVGMTWDFAEVNPFSNSTGNWLGSLEWIPKCLEALPSKPKPGYACQRDAAVQYGHPQSLLVSTDPPYYTNITFADFADFFYGTFRHSLKESFPDLFGTLASPKVDEAVAAWHRFDGDRNAAATHFRAKLQSAVSAMRSEADSRYPISLFYAFKETEFEAGTEVFYTAWESILSVLVEGGMQVIRTWPMRTERTTGRKGRKNALSSSIVIACRPRLNHTELATRADLMRALRAGLPAALRELQSANIAPVDLAQASIGPGMAIYSRYSKVLEPNGERLSVRSALQLINQALDEYLTEQEGDLDADTRFAVAWFEQYGYRAGEFGVADVLARAKNTSVEGVARRGLVTARGGQVKLVHWGEEAFDAERFNAREATVWGATQHLIRALTKQGEEGAAGLLARMPPDLAADARQLAYRLYAICERKGWAELARDYNALVISWSQSQEQAAAFRDQYQQMDMF